MNLAIVGGGGFIGTNLTAALDDEPRIIEQTHPESVAGCDAVIHLAANADVRNGWANPSKDIIFGPMLTSYVLEEMQKYGVRRLIFASSAAVYEPSAVWHSESASRRATSLYAASKIACEELIHAWQAAGRIDATILRFVSVLGPHYSHGLLVDFMKKLRADPTHLDVLAPGTSQKSYVHVADVVSAITTVLEQDTAFTTYNVATHETATPLDIATWCIEEMGLDSEVRLVGETWIGDNPVIRTKTDRLRRLGWAPTFRIEDAVKDTVRWLSTTT